MKILADKTLPLLTKYFRPPYFDLSLYSPNDISNLNHVLKKQDILLCRSTLKVTPTLLEHSQLKCVATASSGSDHINADYLATKQISLLDAKGSNAHAVADYMLCIFAYLNIDTTQTIGIMGMGHVGSTLANRLSLLGYQLLPFDLPRMQRDTQFVSKSFAQFCQADVFCIHANLHDTMPYPSKDAINQAFFKKIKPNTILINAARGGIVNEDALLNHSKPLIYCTDVYCNEPHINPQIVKYASICTPHVAGHSIEAKSRAVTYLYTKICERFDIPHCHTFKHTTHSGYQPESLEAMLNAYHPIHETNELKQAHAQHKDLHHIFLRLRKAHNFRHEFDNSAFIPQ